MKTIVTNVIRYRAGVPFRRRFIDIVAVSVLLTLMFVITLVGFVVIGFYNRIGMSTVEFAQFVLTFAAYVFIPILFTLGMLYRDSYLAAVMPRGSLKLARDLLKRFARKKSFSNVRQSPHLQFEDIFPVSLLRGIHEVRYDTSVNGFIHSLPFELSLLSMYGAPADIGINTLVLNLDLDVLFPHIVVDALDNNVYSMSDFPMSFDASQAIDLEGDFNQHFQVFMPENAQADVLDVLSPDFMQSLIHSSLTINVEIIGNQVYLFTRRPRSMADVDRIFRAASILAKDIKKKQRVWQPTFDPDSVPLLKGQTYNHNVYIKGTHRSAREISYGVFGLAASIGMVFAFINNSAMGVVMLMVVMYALYSLFNEIEKNNDIG